MKKYLKFIPLMLVMVFGIALSSCSDDKDEPVPAADLPKAAKTFLSTYYPDAKIVSSVKDHDDYEVTLSNNHEVEFNKHGEWQDVDAPEGEIVPSGFYPASIDTYVDAMENVGGINEISRYAGGYEVDLVNGVELFFNADGQFVNFEVD